MVLAVNGVAYNNKLVLVCSVFTGAMLHQSLGVDFWTKPYTDPHEVIEEAGDSVRGAGYSNRRVNREPKDPKYAYIFNELEDTDYLQPGDILMRNGHSMIYVGVGETSSGKKVHQIAQTTGTKNVVDLTILSEFEGEAPIRVAQIKTIIGKTEDGVQAKYPHVHRLDPAYIPNYDNWVAPTEIIIQWPSGLISHVDPNDISVVRTEYDETMPLFYSGLATPIGSIGTTNRLAELIKRIIQFLKDILNFIIGMLLLILRAPFIGLTYDAEVLVSAAAQAVSAGSTGSLITFEKIIFNQVPLFDINIFNMTNAGGVNLLNETGNAVSDGAAVIISLRQLMAGWYYAFRNFTIAVMLAILVYLGVRMAITSIAEEKAEYKRMLVDWLVSFFMVMFVHYFLVIVLNLNDTLVNLLRSALENTGVESIYESSRLLAYSVAITEGWLGTIMYISLVVLMVKFALKYAKRMLSGYILIMLSPLVSISYAIDKIKDNRSQSLSKWIKEVCFTILIQSLHVLVYVTFEAGIIHTIASSGGNFIQFAGMTVFMVIAVGFMESAEHVIMGILGFESSSILKESMNSTLEAIGTVKKVKSFATGYYKLAWKGAKFGAKGVGKGIKFGTNQLKQDMRFMPFMAYAGAQFAKVKQFGRGLRNGYRGRDIDEERDSALGGSVRGLIAKEKAATREMENKARDRRKAGVGQFKGAMRSIGHGILAIGKGSPVSGVLQIVSGVSRAAKLTRETLRGSKRRSGNKRNVMSSYSKGKGKYAGQRGTKESIHEYKRRLERENLLFELDDRAVEVDEQIEELISKVDPNNKALIGYLLHVMGKKSQIVGSKEVLTALDGLVARRRKQSNNNR
ncbi:MAG: hypothetical protein IKP28_02285 [Clostridia bacterium]|nr:hypothetical protein [Clostridia bacterium]